MPTSTKAIEYGVRYPNGDEDWKTNTWFGHIESPSMRADFQEQHNLRMKQYGMPTVTLVFLRREVETIVSNIEVIDDTVVAPEPPVEEPAEPPVEEPTVEEPPAPPVVEEPAAPADPEPGDGAESGIDPDAP